MTPRRCDVCVIGAGSAGLSVAAGTARLGLDTVLIERGAMGGECLNTGCVPSKALLAVAKRRHAGTSPSMPGLGTGEPSVDFGTVKQGLRDVIYTIAPHDSVARFESLGVTVLRGTATFLDDRTIAVGQERIRARWFVVAAGSRAALPPIPGLDPASVLTNETIFSLRDPPSRLVVLGGGPIGIEMALAHRRLGIPVVLVARNAILPRDEPELVATLRKMLVAEGIKILERATVTRVDHAPGCTTLAVERGGRTEPIAGSHLLVATGRVPATEDLGLEAAGIAFGPAGIAVDARLRTSRRHIFALGDVLDGPRFTHMAAYQAGIVVRNLAFRLPAKVDDRAIPWVTYTDPELAHVGLTEAEARARHGSRVTVVIMPLSRNDRAVAERQTEGLLKVVIGRRGRILGASLLAPAAGEAIGLWCLAISRRLTVKAVADLILPYPTFGETAKAAASAYYAPQVFGTASRRIVGALRRLPRW